MPHMCAGSVLDLMYVCHGLIPQTCSRLTLCMCAYVCAEWILHPLDMELKLGRKDFQVGLESVEALMRFNRECLLLHTHSISALQMPFKRDRQAITWPDILTPP